MTARSSMMDKILTALKNAREQIHVLGSSTDDVNKAHLAELDGLIKVLEVKNPNKEGFYYWILRVGIHATWVEDGADFTDRNVHEMMSQHFRHAYGYELKGEVLGRPPDSEVAKVMGFQTVADYLQGRKKIE